MFKPFLFEMVQKRLWCRLLPLLIALLLPSLLVATNPQSEIFHDFPVFSLDTNVNHVTDCRYAVIEEIPTVLPVNKLSILLLNIRSCRKNFDNFSSYFSNYVCKYSLIALVETWLTQGFCKLFSICGFKHLDSFRANDGGGIRMYHKNTIDVKLLPDFSSVSDVFEVLTVEIACPKKKMCCLVFIIIPLHLIIP